MDESRTRGGCLTTFLIAILIFSSLGMISNLLLLRSNLEMISISKNLLILNILLSLIQMGSIILIFRWKKIGCYLYFGIGVLNIILLLVNKSTTDFTLGTIGPLIGFFIIYLIAFVLIRPIWRYLN